MKGNKSSTASGGGVTLLGALGIVFVTLKLTGYIDWSWWWVLLPFYGPMLLALAILLIFLAFLVVAGSVLDD